MRKWVAFIVALAVLAQAPVAGAQQGFDGAAAKQQDDALAVQIGSRPAGSAAYDQAVAYADAQLQQWGYAPTLQSFQLDI